MGDSSKIILITGAAGEFGRAIVEKFLAQGNIVHGCDRDAVGLDAIGSSLSQYHSKFYPHAVDLSQLEGILDLVNNVYEKSKTIDVLVNCAGVCSGTPIFDMSEQEWDFAYSVNVKAPFFLSKLVAQHMIEQPKMDRRIINISSLVSFTGGILSSPAYSSSKAALTCTTKNYAKLLAPYHISVNEVAPGTAKTKLSKAFIGDRFDEFEKKIPLGRLCLPEDVANAVIFLASREASYITGQTIHVDGGLYI